MSISWSGSVFKSLENQKRLNGLNSVLHAISLNLAWETQRFCTWFGSWEDYWCYRLKWRTHVPHEMVCMEIVTRKVQTSIGL